MYRKCNERASGEIDSISHPTSWRDLRDNERGSAAEDAILISILLPRREGRKKFSDEGERKGENETDNAPTFLLLSCGLRESYFESYVVSKRDALLYDRWLRQRSSINRLTGFPDGHTHVTVQPTEGSVTEGLVTRFLVIIIRHQAFMKQRTRWDRCGRVYFCSLSFAFLLLISFHFIIELS